MAHLSPQPWRATQTVTSLPVGDGGGAYIAGPDGDPLGLLVHPGDDDGHAPGALHPQHVGLLDTRGSEVKVLGFWFGGGCE